MVRPLLPHIIAIAMVKGCGVGVRELSNGLRLGTAGVLGCRLGEIYTDHCDEVLT